MKRAFSIALLTVFSIGSSAVLSSCASSSPVKRQSYAELRTERTFEHDLETVWKAIEEVTRGYKIVERKPAEKKSKAASLKTDWIYSRSRDKYVEYKVNESPRKQYLQTRLRYELKAEKVMGGTQVRILQDEEIENLKPDGSPNGYSGVKPDSSRANELLNRINTAILSRKS